MIDDDGPLGLAGLVVPLASVLYQVGYFGWPLLFPPAEGDEAATSIISRVAQARGDRGVSYLLRFLSPTEQAAIARAPNLTSRFLGQAVHRRLTQLLAPTIQGVSYTVREASTSSTPQPAR